MTSSIFNDLQSPVSYDADFDRGWRQISEKGEDLVKCLYELLRRVYWEAVQDEMANAILAFDDYKTFVPKGLPELDEGELESEYLRELIDLWDPLELPGEIKDSVCQSVFEVSSWWQKCVAVGIFLTSIRTAKRPAGRLDRSLTPSSMRQDPILTTPCLIYWPHDKDSPITTMSRSTDGRRSLLWEQRHKWTGGTQESTKPSSVQNAARVSAHFTSMSVKMAAAIYHYTFSQELDALEDHNRGQSLMSFGNAFLDHITAGVEGRGGFDHCPVRESGGSMTNREVTNVNPSLYLLASKLGKTQKLAYSRMSNNCQEFCNGLLDYDSYYHPVFSTMYPFIPVSLSLDVGREPDERPLSYLQSFVKPLRYPIPGFRSQRAMIGSAVTMYSSYAQNDADLIDHVHSVRFGRDRENEFSLGFNFSKPLGGDPYLLKDEEMSCSDRFAAAHLPGSLGVKRCTLADHVLDCPVDNLSILQAHLHRNVKYYIGEEGEFLTDLGSTAWIMNRLQIFRRLNLLNAFMPR
ncbi:hypothetical protein BJY00DRAFT_308822 [Aspergillus carlsbadensis]|nr:hypothetical protein BJY00DRAFT_308822 [Aspergillus carlsbadensis]